MAAVSAWSSLGVTMARRRNVRGELYHGARVLGNLEAASQGPGAFVKRRVRARAYAKTNGLLRRFLKGLGS